MEIFELPTDLVDFVSNYDKKTYNIWDDSNNTSMKKFRTHIRNHYLNEQKLTCFYCKQYIFSENGLHWQVEHILPKSLFPQFLFHPHNLIVICPDCNREKSNQNPHIDGENGRNQINYPSTSGRFKIVHPFFDDYYQHIDRVSVDHCEYPEHYFIKALTKKGKATVKMCDLNRFYQDFAGYKDMKGKQVESIDKFIEDNGLDKLSKAQKKELANRLLADLLRDF